MDTQRLLKELAKNDLVSGSVLKKLEARLADKSDIPSPRAVAKFLVDNGHLTTAQAKRALRAILTPEESAVLDAMPISSASDDLPDLPSLSGVHMAAGNDVGSLTGAAPPGVMDEPTPKKKSKPKSKSKKKKKAKGQSEWDSPLILMGGGGLILLLLIGAAILFLLGSETGDQRFKNAEDAYAKGSYPQAIADFEEYLEKNPSHPKVSVARVRLGTARIRMETEVKRNYEAALLEARTQTDIIEDEEEYKEGQAELNALLPTIAEELAKKADQATEIEAMQKYVGLTEEALALCNNTKLIPGKLRDDGQLNTVRDVLERIRLRQKALEDLRDTLEVMAEASDASNPKDAYAAHTAFVKAHPELSQHEEIIAGVAAAAEAEETLVKFVAETQPGESGEPDSPVQAELAVAVPRVQAQAPASGVTALRLAGGLYGVSAKDGKLAWRRAVGAAPTTQRSLTLGDDLVVVDTRRKELLKLKAATGEVVWRAPLADEVAQPTIVGDNVLCPGISGKLHVINAESGDRLGYVQFAQPLRTAPAASEDGKTIYLTGEHSSFYSLSAADFSCLGVLYLGHAKGSVAVAPISVQGRVMVIENDGAATSSLHVLGVDERGAAAKRLKTQRLNGLVKEKPRVSARRFLTVTDTGQIDVFEASNDDDTQPIVLLASRQPTRARRVARHSMVVNGELWLADIGLARYSISPSGNRLPVRDVAEPFRGDTFIHPLKISGGVVIHARKRRNKPGVAVGATDLKNGKVYWQTDLGAPPAGAPVSQAEGNELLHATSIGRVFRVGAPSTRFEVVNEPLAVEDGQWPVFQTSGAQSNGAVFWAQTQGLAATALGDASLAPMVALPGEIACQPVALGEGWVVPLVLGQVHYVRAADGAALAAPFQPILKPSETRAWRSPAVFENRNRIVIADQTSIHTLELVGDNPARLEEVARIEATGADRAVSRVAAADGLAFVARRDGRLSAFASGSLEESGVAQLGAIALWGPYAIDGRVLVATAADELLCIEAAAPGQVAWRRPVAASDLVGSPLAADDGVTLAHRSGELLTLAPATGDPIATVDVGQRLGAGPTRCAAGLALATEDGAILIVQHP